MSEDRKTPFPPDPLVNEVRAARRRLLERFDNDLEKYVDYLRSLEQQHPERMARPKHLPEDKP